MNDPLERLRRANPVPTAVPAPAIEPVLRLLEAEPLPRDVRRTERRGAGRLTLVAGTAVALAVAVLAVVLVGRTHAPRTPQPPAALKVPAFAGLPGLRSEFGVFRRSQTAADRAFHAPKGMAVIAGLTRLARTLPDGVRVFLTVDRLVSGPGHALDYALDTWLVAHTGAQVGQYVIGTPLPVAPHGFALAPGPTVWVSVVPNTVKNVRWSFHGSVVNVAARDNVAAAQLPATSTGVPTVAWYGAHGRQLGGTTAVNGQLLAGVGLLGVRFGTSYRETIAILDTELGYDQPTASYRRVPGACTIDHSAAWDALSVFFWRGRFVGYQYGSFRRTLRPALIGPGVGVGENVAAAASRLGRAFTTSSAQGGSWSLRTSSGRVFGYASAPRGGKIVTIDAGHVGCPGITP